MCTYFNSLLRKRYTYTNIYLHILPACTILCSIILDLVKKHFSQCTHLNGLSPKITTQCNSS
jgi:hypothetical protein